MATFIVLSDDGETRAPNRDVTHHAQVLGYIRFGDGAGCEVAAEAGVDYDTVVEVALEKWLGDPDEGVSRLVEAGFRSVTLQELRYDSFDDREYFGELTQGGPDAGEE